MKTAAVGVNNDYLFNKKKKNFFTRTLFSEWIIEMRVTSAGGGMGGRVMRHLFDSRENK
jgi:hypothetical protein